MRVNRTYFPFLVVEVEFFTPIVSKLPKFISSKLLYDNIKNKTLEEFDKHCGRVRYDFSERVTKSIYGYKNQLDETLGATISEIANAIKQGLEEKNKRVKDEEEALLLIHEQENNLLKAKEFLTG